MFVSILKFATIYLLSFYACHKLDKTYICSKSKIFVYILCSIVLALETYVIKVSMPEFTYLIPAFTFFAFFSLCMHMPSLHNFFICLVSLGLNLLIFSFVSLIISIVITILYGSVDESILSMVVLITILFYPPVIFSIFKIKRLSNGILLAHSSFLLNLGSILSAITLTLFTIEQVDNYKYSIIHLIRILLLILLLIVFFVWWKVQITNSYKRKLYLLELNTLRASNNELQTYIHNLEEENKRLGKIIHKDNRIVNALADSVKEYLSANECMSKDMIYEKGTSILNELNQLFDDRQILLNSNNCISPKLHETKKIGIDAILSYMQKEAAASQIELVFFFDQTFINIVNNSIDENDIVHLISDLLENAIIATRCAKEHKIELSMNMLNTIPIISVSDNGIPFDIDTYMNLGIKNSSTHLDSGGQGIGFIDIWNIKNSYAATLCIEEFSSNPNFTKRITLMFDKQNRYIISSARSTEITSKLIRSDLTVLEHLHLMPFYIYIE